MKKIAIFLAVAAAVMCFAVPVFAEDGAAEFEWGQSILISLGIGLLVGLIVALVLRGQLKSVHKQNAAAHYLDDGSVNITLSRDNYLYTTTTVTPRPKPQQNSSSGM